jgi:uncharacterized protein (TIGR03067 family)
VRRRYSWANIFQYGWGDIAMRHWMLLWIPLGTCLLAGCGLSTAADTVVEQSDDRAAWQGTWKLVSCVSGGKSQVADMAWVVRGDRYTIRIDGIEGQDPYPFELDSSQKRVYVNHHDTPEGTYGGKFKGIYEVNGNALKVCYDLKGEQYPQSFAACQSSGYVLFEFRRE